ncbi:MAG: hypothetical protein SGPRY_013535 [Prymnesium sp.]
MRLLVLLLPLALWAARRRRRRQGDEVGGVLDLVGSSPLLHLRSLSAATGCTILAKAEFLNPGGSSKDRVALRMVREAEAQGRLLPGGALVEATQGSTGVSLALVARACGYRCILLVPDDVSDQKLELMRALGAEVEVVKPAAIANPAHPVNKARARAEELGKGSIFTNQAAPPLPFLLLTPFDNLANLRAHEATGREVWKQTRGKLHAFVMGAGTGGTIAGVSRFLKARAKAQVYPPGSGLHHRVVNGVLYDEGQQEVSAKRHRYDSMMEGVGCDRITANFEHAIIDDALRISDEESVGMARHLLEKEGLFVGGSAAMNCVGAGALRLEDYGNRRGLG